MPAERRLEELSRGDLRRYSRHLILPEVGLEGQEKLKNGRALLVGAGGLGSPAALYLAAAGVGRIGLIDSDVVDESNLQRQILHGVRDLGRPKTASARDRLRALNPLVEIETFDVFLDSSNALDIFGGYDLVLDGTDNFPTRYLANDACVLLKKPYIYGSIYRFEGQASVFGLPGGPCYRCFFAEPPPPGLVPSCGEGGVLGVLPGIIGCVQAAEAIKVLLGETGNTLSGRLLLLDAWKMKFRELKLRRNPACPVCGDAPSIRGLIDYQAFCGLKKDQNLEPVPQITARELRELFAGEPGLQVIDIREPHELALGKLPNTRAMPYGQLVRRLDELDPTVPAVVVCKIGVRSEMAVRLLKDAGYQGRIMNLEGGVNAWAREVDPAFVVY
ncbi:MAG: molybdopterin-synthase adenylyltransferase MoeB [Planctomycetota bacterium]|jgi:adenylyltransferase/sulfurtransferase|nr:molybdopterin-synthase adenylyltransferase MoeB [Planctomycetota bacterium]